MGVLMTDELTLNVAYDGKTTPITLCYGDYFKALYERAYAEFGIEPLDQARFAIYEPSGSKLPKTAQIYNVAEVSDGITVQLKLRG